MIKSKKILLSLVTITILSMTLLFGLNLYSKYFKENYDHIENVVNIEEESGLAIDNGIVEEDEGLAQPLSTVPNSSHLYMLTKNGQNTYYSAMTEVIKNLANGATITLRSGVNMSYSFTFPSTYSNVTFDLNGYAYTRNFNGTFITVEGHNFTIKSSRAGGKLQNFNQGASATVIRLQGRAQNWRPKLTILHNVYIGTNGDTAIINENGVLDLNGPDVISRTFFAVQTFYINGANQVPQLLIKGNTKLYGLHLGKKGGGPWAGDVIMTGGYIYPSKHNNWSVGASTSSSNMRLEGGYVARTDNRIATVDSWNKSKNLYELRGSTTINNVAFAKVTRYYTFTYELRGAKITGATTVRKYQGVNLVFPTNVTIARAPGAVFKGWMNKSTGGGPFSSSDLDSNTTYYPRFEYVATYNPNGDTVNPVTGASFNRTHLAGLDAENKPIYTTLPQNTFVRAGYEFVGWATSPNVSHTETSKIYKANTQWNHDGEVKNGKLNFYAIWKPITVSYRAEYYFENLQGQYVYDSSKTRTFNTTTGSISNPGREVFTGFQNIDSTVATESAALNSLFQESRVVVKGNGSTVIKLYYRRLKYNVTFDLDGGRLTSGSLTTTVKYQDTAIAPTGITKDGYRFIGWDKSRNNITGNTTIKAMYEAADILYNFDFNLKDDKNNVVSTVISVDQKYLSKIVFPELIDNRYGQFLYWKDANGKIYDANSIADSTVPITLYAYWMTKSPTVSSIDVLFKSNDSVKLEEKANIDYLLIEGSNRLPISTDNWQHNLSIFRNLRPNTRYNLWIREHSSNSYYIEGNPVYMISFTTLPAPSQNIAVTVDPSDTSITILAPYDGIDYVIKDVNGNYITGSEASNGDIMFTNLASNQEFELFVKTPLFDSTGKETGEYVYIKVSEVYDLEGRKLDKIKTKFIGEAFVGNKSIVMIEINTNYVVFNGRSENEYRIKGTELWVTGKPNLKMDRPSVYETLVIEVRNKETDFKGASLSEIAETSTKLSATQSKPTQNDLLHNIRIENSIVYLEAKAGFIYFDSSNNEITPVNGLIQNQSGIRLKRVESNYNDLSDYSDIIQLNEVLPLDQSELSDAIWQDTKISIPVLENIVYRVIDENGKIINGVLENNKYVFKDLDPKANYIVEAKKSVQGYQDSPWVDVRQVKELYLLDIEYDITDQTFSTISGTLDKVYEYRYTNKDNQVITNIDDKFMMENLLPATTLNLEVRLTGENLTSNWVRIRVSTKKMPSIIDESMITEIKAEIVFNQIELKETDVNYEYALLKEGDIFDESKLDFRGGQTSVLFDMYGLENIQHATKYLVYQRIKSTATSVASNTLQSKVNINGIVNGYVVTPKLPTRYVEVPTISDLTIDQNTQPNEIKVLAKPGYMFAVILNSAEITMADFKTEVHLTNLTIGDTYYVYAYKLETDTEERSEYVRLQDITLVKKTSTLVSSELPTLTPTNITSTSFDLLLTKGFDYSIDGVNWIIGNDLNHTFSNLDPASTYTVIVRKSESNLFLVSNELELLDVITLKTPTSSVGAPTQSDLEINFVDVKHNSFKITTKSNLEYSIDQINWFKGTNNELVFTGLEANTEYFVYVRYAETDTQEVSPSVLADSITTMKLPPEAINLTITLNEINGKRVVVILPTDVEYSYEVRDLEGLVAAVFSNVSGEYIVSNLELDTTYEIFVKVLESETYAEGEFELVNIIYEMQTVTEFTTLDKETSKEVELTNEEKNTLYDIEDEYLVVKDPKPGYRYHVTDKNDVPPQVSDFTTETRFNITGMVEPVLWIIKEADEENNREVSLPAITTQYEKHPTPTLSTLPFEVSGQSVVITATDGFEYSLDGINWVKPTEVDGVYTVEFGGLNPNTKYDVYVRQTESGTYGESDFRFTSDAKKLDELFTTESFDILPTLNEYIIALSKYNELSLYQDLLDEAATRALTINTINGVDELIAEYKEEIDNKYLDYVKAEEITQINDHYDGLSLTNELLTTIKNDAIAAINAATTEETLAPITQKAISDLDNEELRLYKEMLKTNLEAYVTSKDGVVDAAIDSIVQSAQGMITLSNKSETTYNELLADFKFEIDKELAKRQLNEVYETYQQSNYSPENWAELGVAKNEGVEAIYESTTAAELESSLQTAIDKMAVIKTFIEQKKEEAKQDILDYRSSEDTNVVTDLKQREIDKIATATTFEEVQSILDRAKDLVDAELYRETIVDKLNALKPIYPGENNQTLIDQAITESNEKTSTEALDQLYEDTKTQLDVLKVKENVAKYADENLLTKTDHDLAYIDNLISMVNKDNYFNETIFKNQIDAYIATQQKRQDVKQEIEGLIAELPENSALIPKLEALIDRLATLDDDYEVDSIKDEAYTIINVDEKKSDIEKELRDYAGIYASDLIEAIIENQLNRVNDKNFNNETIIESIIKTGKQEIEQSVKDDYSTRLQDLIHLIGDFDAETVAYIEASIPLVNAADLVDVKAVYEERLAEILEKSKTNAIKEINKVYDKLIADNGYTTQKRAELDQIKSDKLAELNTKTMTEDVFNLAKQTLTDMRNVESYNKIVEDLIDDLYEADKLKDNITKEELDDIKDNLAKIPEGPAKDKLEKDLEDVEKAIELRDSQNEAIEETNRLKDSLTNPSTAVTDIIDKAKDDINNAKTPEEVETILDEMKQDVIDQLQKEALDELTTFVDDLLKDEENSKYIEKIIEDTKDAINDATTQAELKEILDKAKQKLEEQVIIDKDNNNLLDKYQKEVTDKIHQYDKDELKRLKDKMDEINDALLQTILTKAKKEALIEEALAMINNLKVIAIGDPTKKDSNFDESNQDPNRPFINVRNESGMEKGTTVVVLNKYNEDSFDEKSLMDKIKALKMDNRFAAGKSLTTLRDILVGQIIFNRMEINLVDQNNVVITEFEGLYIVTLRLSKEDLARENIRVLYDDVDLVEVFDVVRDGEYITFTTDHFSEFYLISDHLPSEIQNLWPYIIILAVIIVILVLLANRKENINMRQRKMNSFTFPMLAAIIPFGAYVIIWIEVIIIILLVIYLIYLYLYAQRTVHSKETVTYVYEVIDDEMKDMPKEEMIEEDMEMMPEEHFIVSDMTLDDLDEAPEIESYIDTIKNVKVTIRNNYSLKARMHQAPMDSQARYNAIKNALLMFEGVKVKSSWKYDRFTYKGKTILKMSIYTMTTKVFFADDPKKLLDRKYNLEDVSMKKVHEKTPYLMRITGPKLEKYVLRIIATLLKKATIIPDYKSKNYLLPYRTKEWLIDQKLIKQFRYEQNYLENFIN